MRSAAVLAPVLAAAALTGCSAGVSASDSQRAERDERVATGALTDAELEWVRAYVGWRVDFDRRTYAGGRDLARRALANCTVTFRHAVGKAPTKRLGTVARLMRSACRDWQRFGELQRRFYDRNDFEVGPRMAAAELHADDASTRAFDRLERLLSEARPLRRIARASDASRIQPRYARVTGALTAREVEVRCWAEDGWKRVLREAAAFQDVASIDVDGFANFYTGRVNLGPDVCESLDDLTYRGERPAGGDDAERAAYAVFVLAHEAAHIAGIDDEAEATCDGLQRLAAVARGLGADRRYAALLAATYWEDVYEQEPREYRTVRCGPGRPLDRSPGDGRWP